ncbi:uncharacterized protein L969DRAFT_94564 [Mixia osmundae IAM 14324]|uniref:Uncharacterized protein n=1 Tax=Mixia osmundae (strain CBS 9802 / IAM 14324 / JCM 22182 / KY 12970) TaxID=764103 RepID=G7E0W6_MIXOS|nr:uncharacterized protein L969DRAFT_94564 [Mixia osmundae IAM 14324]KEI39504.1 hypothetical protein L969DRAFT_94564 [Mixia osmundae IAM 14324]GAA96476.1 hypothetical protein E5Q_03143 [Mixia osmundae IAM 14324]
MSGGYTVPPPSYADEPSKPTKQYGTTGSQEPLLAQQSSRGLGSWGDDASGDLEGQQDDSWKETTVSDSSPEIRQAFIRKVYTMLFLQILGTTLVGVIMSTPSVTTWTQAHTAIVFVPLILAIINLFVLFAKRHSSPANIILLSTFTLLESIGVGATVAMFDQKIVLQALVITCFVFVGLTLFTMQSKYDFSHWGSYLYGILLVFFFTGIVGVFFPFSRVMDAVFAGVGTLLFSAYILYDTHMIMNRLSPDEYIIAVVSLYLDVLNLFLSILRLLNNAER